MTIQEIQSAIDAKLDARQIINMIADYIQANPGGSVDISGKEDISNKSIDVVGDGASNTKYPSVKSIKDYTDSIAFNGSYNPIYSSLSNCSGVTTSFAANTLFYCKVGGMVIISGMLTMTITAGATPTEFNMSLPLPLSEAYLLGGSGVALSNNAPVFINDFGGARFSWTSGASGVQVLSFMFMYKS